MMVYLALLLSVISQTASNIFIKYAAFASKEFPGILFNKYYVLSLILLGLQAVFWQVALRKIELFKAYFFSTINYFLILCSGVFFFKEKITVWNIVGTLVIIAGIIIVVTPDRNKMVGI